IAGDRAPLALVRLLAGRPNVEREAAVARYLAARGVGFARQRFETFEGRGENFAVDVGAGPRVLLLIAHHDAVPGSPGANAHPPAVGILLHLLERARVPPDLRVRFLFTASEELGYLGARAWVREAEVAGIAGVLSLELCGIGDSLAVWDAGDETPFLGRVRGALETLGLRRDVGYHVVGRIPLFGSDHRAFAASGVPAYGLTVIPSTEGEARAQERRDAPALEQALHDDRLRPIAAMHGHEAPRVARLGRTRRKADHLPAAGHRSEYSSAARNAGTGAGWAHLAASLTRK